MKLDEAINHLEESLADQSHDWGCEECKREHEQLLEWLRELKELREQNFILKSTLSAALKDINGKNILEIMTVCKLCAMKFQQLCDVFPWQYANEALKLIGEDGGNDEKSNAYTSGRIR